MISLYNRAIKLQDHLNELSVSPPQNYLDVLIIAYDEKFVEEFLGYFADDNSLNEDEVRAFLEKMLRLTDSSPVSIYARPNSLFTAIAAEFDKEGKIVPLIDQIEADEDTEQCFSAELVAWLDVKAAIKSKQESALLLGELLSNLVYGQNIIKPPFCQIVQQPVPHPQI